MLINITNHPLDSWQTEQIDQAKKEFQTVIDYPFPEIDPNFTTSQVKLLAQQHFENISNLENFKNEHTAILVTGEYSFTFALVALFQANRVDCYCACSSRHVEIVENKKTITFDFIQFRQYSKLMG